MTVRASFFSAVARPVSFFSTSVAGIKTPSRPQARSRLYDRREGTLDSFASTRRRRAHRETGTEIFANRQQKEEQRDPGACHENEEGRLVEQGELSGYPHLLLGVTHLPQPGRHVQAATGHEVASLGVRQ